MKIKSFWVAFGAVLVFVVLVLCVPLQSASQTRDEILNLIPKEWKDKDLKAMESLADQINCDNLALAKLFESSEFDIMTALHEEVSGTIVNDKYKVVSSKDECNFKAFWRDARTKGSKLVFKTTSVHLTDRLGSQPGVVIKECRPVPVTFNYVAIVVHEFRVIPDEKGAHNSMGLDIVTYAHQDTCPWRDGGRR